MVQQLLLDAEAPHVRLALRNYFTVFLLFVAFLGDRCCSLRVRLRLYRHQLIPLSQMTGWLSGSRLITATASLGATPAGWLGLVMSVVSMLSFACDLAVSVLVVTTHTPGRCHFNTTGGYAVLSQVVLDLYEGSNAEGPLYDMVTNAQATSLRNGGVQGIYVKVNDDQNFRPDEQDVVGTWVCEATGSSKTFSKNSSVDTIVQGLLDDGLLFNVSYWYNFQRSGSGDHGSFVWSASQGDRPVAPWTVLAAVEASVNTALPKQMDVYSCYMSAPSLSWLLEKIEVNNNLQAWVLIVMANVYPTLAAPTNYVAPPSNDPGLVIATKLNAMMMITGTAWGIEDFPATISDPTIGCFMPRKLIPWSVSALFALTTILAIGMAVYLLTLIWLNRMAKISDANTPAYIKVVEEGTPDGLIGWMKRATEETGILVPESLSRKRPRADGIRGWILSLMDWQWAKAWRFGPSTATTATAGGRGPRQRLTGLVYLTATAIATFGSGESRELLTIPLPSPSPSMQKYPSIDEVDDVGHIQHVWQSETPRSSGAINHYYR